jgi:hypothetical protein
LLPLQAPEEHNKIIPPCRAFGKRERRQCPKAEAEEILREAIEAIKTGGHQGSSRCACADIIETVAERIDAKTFNPAFPAVFPRFVQHAIWRYCARSGLDVCNGNRVDDQKSCENVYWAPRKIPLAKSPRI